MKSVIHILSGDLWGGAEAQAGLQLQALLKTDWQPRAILFNSGLVCDRFRQMGIPVEVVEESGGFGSLLKDVPAAVKRSGAQIVVSHGYKETIVAAKSALTLGLPLITTYHGLTENIPGIKGLKLKIYQKVERTISKVASKRIVTVSARLAQDLGFARSPRLRIIRNVAAISPANSVIERPPKDRPVILALGRLVPVKRLDLLIEAVNLLRSNTPPINASLRIAGEGPELNRLRALTARFNLTEVVEFLGFQNDPGALLRSSTTLAISSDSEGIPTALIEAFATRTPVAATNVGGIPEVVALFPGYPASLCAAGSAIDLAQAIKKVLEAGAGSLESSVIESTLELNFSPDSAAKQLATMYTEISG